jgi:hypothetical protein
MQRADSAFPFLAYNFTTSYFCVLKQMKKKNVIYYEAQQHT